MRIWLVCADEEKCNHVAAFENLGFISWVEAPNAHMAVEDIVYVFMSDTRRLRYKTRVTKIHEARQDTKFWLQEVEKARQEITCCLVPIVDYGEAGGLTEEELWENGLNPHALQHPKLLNYDAAEHANRQLSRFIIDFDQEYNEI